MKLHVISIKESEQPVISAFRAHGLELCAADGIQVSLEQSAEAGYTVAQAEDSCKITYDTLPNLCRALLFLSAEAEAAPGKTVHEKSAFQDCGFMLDASRNAVPRPATVKDMLFYAACMGYQFVGLYMEDTLAVDNEPYFGYMRGRLTKDEIRDMDAYALSLGMELRPYIQVLAHLNQITRYERYQRITDAEDILLVGDPRTEELIDHILATVKDCFSTNNINLGMDEAWLLGSGKYLERNGFHPRSEIMVQQLNMALRLCQKYGFKPQMWSDMFFHAYERGEKFQIPEGVQIFHWDYYSTEKEHYEKDLNTHKQISDHVGFVTGAWKWTGFVPHNGYSVEIGKASIAACKSCGFDSLLIGGFGDDGAEASHFSILPALYQDAMEVFESQMDPKAFELLTGLALDKFMEIDLVNPYLENHKIHNNCSKCLLYNDPLIGTFDSLLKEDTVARFHMAEEKMAACAEKGPFAYLFETMRLLSHVLTRKADLGIRIRGAYDKHDLDGLRAIADEEIPVLLEDLGNFYKTFEHQWKKESKSFGFEVQTIRFGALRQRLEDVREQLLMYAEGSLGCIEELEEPLQSFSYFENVTIEGINYNLWSNNVSPSVIG